MLSFGRYRDIEMSAIPTEYLEAVGPQLAQESDRILRELQERQFACVDDDKIKKEPAGYRKFCKACIHDGGKQFLDDMKLTGKEWEYWFLYIASQNHVARNPNFQTPSRIALEYFTEIGVEGFAG